MLTQMFARILGREPDRSAAPMEAEGVRDLVDSVLFVDVEADRRGRLHSVGAVLGDRRFRWDAADGAAALARLDGLAEGARWIAGHNILAHDLPVLRDRTPTLRLLDLPVLDTLILSPLAFPANPYHRLVKDYKLVGDAVNDPVADADLSRELLSETLEAFARMARADGPAAMVHRFALSAGGRNGMADLLGLLGVPAMPSSGEALAVWRRAVAGKVCGTALAGMADADMDPADARLAFAYTLAWIGVAGANSVLPAWVRASFPAAARLVERLRDTACDDPHCAWCRTAFDPLHWLGQTFGYPAYRAEPAADDGGSLQQRIVEAGLNSRPLLAVLPTGGGKSLCFQVPAIARYHRTGALTVVVSPLQALMKDQVDNFEAKTGRQAADALYGTLTLPERGAVMDRARLGDTAILYVSPEQLRNPSVRRTLEQRSIGGWVFDEAHCLSNWGHDFRPDYLFVARFVRELAERQGVPPPPVACFTATARHEVVAEIRRHFKEELAQDLLLFDGGVERPNLSYRVEAVGPTDKVGRIAELLAEHLPHSDRTAVAIVYAATRRRTEELRDALGDLGYACAAFHAGLRPPVKQQIQTDFVTGAIRVVVATNAFGMGIDKDTVRLVVHAEVPGSIEAYLQEAGRAGRDREPATCVLLYDPADLETQFRLAARSELSRQDMAQILRGVRKLAGRLKRSEVVATTGELIADPDLALGFRPEDQDADTRVKTALAWLERARLLQRDENRTWVVSARPRISSVADAARIMAAQSLPEGRARQWMAIFRILAAAAGGSDGEERSLTIDELARSEALREEVAGLPPHEAARRILSIIGQMAQAGLVDRGTALTAQVRGSGANATRRVLERVGAMAVALIDVLREEAPDGDGVVLAPRGAAQRLRDQGHADAQPESVRTLLKILTQAERGQAGAVPRLKLTRGMLGHWRLRPTGPWDDLGASLKRRLAVAAVVVERLLAVARETEAGGSLLIPFTLEDLADSLRRDLTLAGAVHDPLDAVTGACLLLHDARAIVLQNGLSVFRQGLTLRLPPEAKGRRYGKADHEPLAGHYEARARQIHAMGEYARLGLRAPERARTFAADYFALPTDRLLARHFPGRRIELSRPVARETYDAIVTTLDNPAQQAIVTADPEKNLLVLAGPGSGKTRVVVHRCAYLLRVKRVPAPAILVVCFNRSAALSVRRRLRDLIGDEAAHVDVHTYHALAMRLVGVSFTERSERVDAQLNAVITDATALLRGERPFPGLDPEEVRERLLARYRHILIDEYQDIDPGQYDLISAIAGRQESDPDARIALMAVGDDDQGVYGFRGASVEFIRRFQADYGAEARYLVENYRSTRAILAAAGAVIAANTDRMKRDRPVEVDRRRRADPPGDPVRVLAVGGEGAQLGAALAEVRVRAAAAGGWERVAVLGRNRMELAPFHALCDRVGVPADPAYDDTASAFPLHRLRELRVLLDRLARSDAGRLRPGALRRWIARLRRSRPSPWWALADRVVAEVTEQTGGGRVPVSVLREQIHESLAQLRRDRASGRGVYIGTLHGAKGLEFDHVVILDGAFERRGERHDPEEERRLFYVGMTRARRSLCLLSRADLRHPHLPLLAGQPVERVATSGVDADAVAVLKLQRRVLGLGDLDIGFAGRQPPGDRIHRELARLNPGDPLTFDTEEDGRVFLRTASGTAVAAIARGDRDFWFATARTVERASVLAVVQRFRTDGARDYRDRTKAEQWEIPVVEVWTRTVR